MKKCLIVTLCETGVCVTLDYDLFVQSMASSGMPKPIHAFNSLDKAIAYIRKTLKEAREPDRQQRSEQGKGG